MNNILTQTTKFGVLFLLLLSGFSTQVRTVFAQARTDDSDAKTYSEIKTAIEKYEEKLDPSYVPTAEEANEALRAASETLGVLAGKKVADKPVRKLGIDFNDLFSKCDLLIKHNPKMPDYYRLRGKARYYKSLANSPAMFTQASLLQEANLTALISTADITTGIKDFSDALTINPAAKLDDIDAADAHLFRGKLYAISAAKSYSKQNLQNALVDFDDFISLDGCDLPPDDFRKGIYLLSKDGDLVGQDFTRRIKADPSGARSIYLERAGYLTRIVDYSRALADLLRYADSSVTGSKDDLTIVKLRYDTLNVTAAHAAERLDVLDAENNLETAAFVVQFPDKQEQALKNATDALERNPRLTAAYVIRAKVLLSKGQLDEAMAAANAALTQDADNVGALCVRALGYAIKNDIRTLDDFNRAIALDPELAFLYNAFGNRAKIYTALGKADLAAADAQKSEQLAKKLAEIRQ